MNSRQTFIFKHFTSLFETYNGTVPFQYFFKKHCKQNPSLGSKDRRLLREICYRIFRSGTQWKNKPLDELFLWPASFSKQDDLLNDFYEGLEKVEVSFDFDYPFKDLLVEELRNPEFYESQINQPLVWVRVNQSNKDKFKSKYKDLVISEFEINSMYVAFGLSNSTPIEPEPLLFEIQDLASQQVSANIKLNDTQKLKVWDCCCGAGGKSLFLAEEYKRIEFYASDIRPAILDNLKTRFKQKRLTIPKLASIDLNKKPEKINFNGQILGRDFFDVILADVPCSGSGTWAREPEYFTYFDARKMDEIVSRQFEISKSSLRFLRSGGKFYYITCSVFERENQGVVNRLAQECSVKLVKMENVFRYQDQADNLFIAEFEKI